MEIEYATPTTEEVLKTPPFSKEAEQSVIGGLMLDNDAWLQVSEIVVETDFYLQQHQMLFQAIYELAKQNFPLDPITLSTWLQSHNKLEEIGGGSYLGLLANNTPSAAHVVTYASIVREKSVLRNLIKVGMTITESAFNTHGKTTTELLDDAEKEVFQIAELGHTKAQDCEQIDTILTNTLNRIEILSQQDGGITGIATGFIDFDKKTAGLQQSDLIIIAGRPSMGKTALALNIAENVAVQQKKAVAIFSMEMSSEQLVMRLISSLASVNLQNVRTGQLNNQEWDKISRASATIGQSLLFIDETPALSPLEIRSKVRRLVQKNKQIDLIIIDYLQLMQSSKNNDSRVNEVSEISRSLKALAKEINVPVIALSQLNRRLENQVDKRPKMADLRESGSIEQDADLIAFIYRDEVYDEESPDKGKAEIIISKQRNGPIGTSILTFRGDVTKFENHTSDSFGVNSQYQKPNNLSIRADTDSLTSSQ